MAGGSVVLRPDKAFPLVRMIRKEFGACGDVLVFDSDLALRRRIGNCTFKEADVALQAVGLIVELHEFEPFFFPTDGSVRVTRINTRWRFRFKSGRLVEFILIE